MFQSNKKYCNTKLDAKSHYIIVYCIVYNALNLDFFLYEN